MGLVYLLCLSARLERKCGNGGGLQPVCHSQSREGSIRKGPGSPLGLMRMQGGDKSDTLLALAGAQINALQGKDIDNFFLFRLAFPSIHVQTSSRFL